MDPRICCALGVCCPPDSAEQLDTLAGLIAESRKGAIEQGRDIDHAVASMVLKLFGTGPHDKQLAALEAEP